MLSVKPYQNMAVGFVLIVLIIVGCAGQTKVSEDKDNDSAALGESVSSNKGSETVKPANADESSVVKEDKINQSAPAGGVVEKNAEQTSLPKMDDSIEKYNALAGQMAGGKKLSIPKITGSVNPRNDAYHDIQGNAIVVLQDPTQAMKDFPRDRRMEVDWVKTLDQGHIEPRADLLGKSTMSVLDKDILMKNTQFMPWVKFPHKQHTKWLACENCHPAIFIPKEDANPISMNKVLRGEYCGVCHDKVAFALFVCERCHSVPHEGSGPKWW